MLLTNLAKQGYVGYFSCKQTMHNLCKAFPYLVHIILVETYLVLTFLRMPPLSHNEIKNFNLNTRGKGEPARSEFICKYRLLSIETFL